MKKADKIFLILGIATILMMVVLIFAGTKAQEQKKIKYDSIKIDSTKFLRLYFLKGDTAKIDTLAKHEQHKIRLEKLHEKIKK